MSGPAFKSVVYVDTNMFMHFQPLANFPWSSMVSTPVELVICQQVLRELNEIKDSSPNQGKADRARSAIKLALASANAPSPVGAEAWMSVDLSPPPAQFPATLSKDVYDDWIIAAALLRLQQRSDPKVFILSSDAYLILKAPKLGVEALVPEERLKLPRTAPDLASSLPRKQTAPGEGANTVHLPKPKLTFENGAKHVKVVVPNASLLGEVPDPPEIVAAKHAEIPLPGPKPEQPAVDGPNLSADQRALLRTFRHELAVIDWTWTKHRESDIIEYNRQLAEYLDRYRKRYEQWNTFRATLERFLCFSVVLENKGEAPLNRPELRIAIEGGTGEQPFRFVESGRVPRAPTLPPAPEPPIALLRAPHIHSQLSVDQFQVSPAILRLAKLTPLAPVLSELFPVISYPTDRQRVEVECDTLRHGSRLVLGPFVLENTDLAVRGCNLAYEVHAHNLPKPTTGRLQIHVAT